MKAEWQINEYDSSSKIWIYTINPSISTENLESFQNDLAIFCTQWTAHNKELRSFYKLIDKKILILGVDEHLNPASGCSIDKSVHFLEDLEKKYNIEIFNRMLFTYVNETGELITLKKNDFEKNVETGVITTETKVVNNLCLSLLDWNAKGIEAIKNTWMMNFFGITIS